MRLSPAELTQPVVKPDKKADPKQNGAPKAGSSDNATKQPEGVKHDRSSFINGKDSGVPTNTRTGRESGQFSQEVFFSPELQARFESYLHTFVKDIWKLRESEYPAISGKTKFDMVMENQAHQSTAKMWKRLAVREADGTLDMAKTDENIKNFLNNGDQGWIMTAQLIEDMNPEGEAAIGCAAATLPQSERNVLIKKRNIVLEGHFWRRLFQDKGVVKQKDMLNIEQSADALDALKTSATNIAYIDAIYGIDLYALRRKGTTGKVEQVPGRAISADFHQIEKIQEQVLQGYKMLQMMYKELGAPYRGEFSNAHLDKAVQDEFKTLLPFGGTDVDVIRAKLQANRNVLARRAEESINAERKAGNKDKPMALITRKIADRTGENSAEMQRRTGEATKKKGELEEEKNKVKEKQTHSEPLKQKKEELESVTGELTKDFGVAITTNFLTDIQTEIDRLEKEIDGDPTTVPPKKSLDDQIADLRSAQDLRLTVLFTQYTTDRKIISPTAGPKGIDPREQAEYRAALNEARADARQSAEDEYKNKIAKLREKETKYKEIAGKLEELKNRYKTTQEEIKQQEKVVVSEAPKELVEIKAAYDSFVGAVGATISGTQLESMNIDQLIALAIMPPHSCPNATPEQKAKLRQELLRAKSEHKAMKAETYDPSPANDKKSFDGIVGVGPTLTSNDLLTRSWGELYHVLTTDPAYMGAVGAIGRSADAVLAEAVREAQKKLIIRYGISLEEQAKDLEEQIKEQERIIKSGSDLKPEIDRLQATQDLMGRQSEISEGGDRIIANKDKFTKRTILTPTDPDYGKYSEAEQKAGFAKGYYEMMDYLFAYRENPEKNRNEYFKQISSVLPPQKLAEVLFQTFGWMSTPQDLDTAFVLLDSYISAKIISEEGIRSAFNNVVDTVYHDTLVAMP